MEFRFNPEITLSYGVYECSECGNRFYGGGGAIHKDGCTTKGYNGTVYEFGQKEFDKVKDMGFSPLGPGSLTPEVAIAAEQAFYSHGE